MSRPPGRAQLVRVLAALGRHLPGQLVGLLEAARFDPERPALQRLAEPEHARAAASAMTEDEADWMARTLLERWAAVGEVVLEPIAAIRAPAEIWIGRQPLTIPLEVAVDGLEDGWSATWEGDSSAAPGAAAARLRATPPGDGPAFASARVKVEGRCQGRRTLLVDRVRIAIRTPRLVVRDDRRQILVRDQAGRAAAAVNVRIGEMLLETDSHGLIAFDATAEPGAEILVAGVHAGRVPD